MIGSVFLLRLSLLDEALFPAYKFITIVSNVKRYNTDDDDDEDEEEEKEGRSQRHGYLFSDPKSVR
jgi:hypothetical protein